MCMCVFKTQLVDCDKWLSKFNQARLWKHVCTCSAASAGTLVKNMSSWSQLMKQAEAPFVADAFSEADRGVSHTMRMSRMLAPSVGPIARPPQVCQQS